MQHWRSRRKPILLTGRLVLRDLSAVDRSQAEADVTAVVKVKSIMDLPVEPGDTWKSISRDEDKLARVEQALQEVGSFNNQSVVIIHAAKCDLAHA